MQMDRYYANSVSSNIRYYGAVRNRQGAVIKDAVVRALSRQVGASYNVEPGAVIVTHPGSLRRTHNVKALLHVAAQHGEPGRGYITIESHDICVKNSLEAADRFNRSLLHRLRLRPLSKSIIFPLFGTRNRKNDPQAVTLNIVRAAKNYLELHPHCTLERVCFLAWTDVDEELCLTAFLRLGLNFDFSKPGAAVAPFTASENAQAPS
jgi:O-acetyl-ADP-ribose deacetylase (regulator of RNase III)